MHAKSFQSGLTLCESMDCSLPGSPLHGLLQARILEWAAMPSSRGSSQFRDWTCVSTPTCMTGGLFATSTIWGARLCCPPSFLLSQFLQQYFTVTCDLTQPCGRGQRGSTLSCSDEASVLSWHHVPESADVVLGASSVPTVSDLYVLLPFLRGTALFLLLSSAAMVFPQCPKSEHLLPFPLQLKVFKGERIWVGFHTFLTLAAIPFL